MGFEPTTLGTTILYSNRLSYIHHLICLPNRCANIHTFFLSPKFFMPILLFSSKFISHRQLTSRNSLHLSKAKSARVAQPYKIWAQEIIPCPHHIATTTAKLYFTLSFLPICRMVVDCMPLRLHILFTVVPYLRAIAPRVSPFLMV